MTTVLAELAALPLGEKLKLVEDLWDQIAASKEELPLPEWQVKELARRKAAHLQNPDDVSTLDEVMDRLSCG